MPSPAQSDLFGDAHVGQATDPGADPAAGLAVMPHAAARVSPAARAFQQHWARIDRVKSQVAELEALGRRFASLFEQELGPLRERHTRLMREMATSLDQRLQGKALSAPQRQTAVSILCGLARRLASEGDAEMAALHDRHSPVNLADKARADVDDLRAVVEDLLGEALPDDLADASPEAVVAAAIARQREKDEARQARRRQAAARRKAGKPPSAAQARSEAQQQDAEQTLRSLYRQLASALHPDRETDPARRADKTALMSEANAAYAQRDLPALMQLQVRAALADADAMAQMAPDRLAAMTRLLKDQWAALERQRAAQQATWARHFELDRLSEVNERDLQRQLAAQKAAFDTQLATMQADLDRVRSDADFKRWLTAQRRLAADDV